MGNYISKIKNVFKIATYVYEPEEEILDKKNIIKQQENTQQEYKQQEDKQQEDKQQENKQQENTQQENTQQEYKQQEENNNNIDALEALDILKKEKENHPQQQQQEDNNNIDALEALDILKKEKENHPQQQQQQQEANNNNIDVLHHTSIIIEDLYDQPPSPIVNDQPPLVPVQSEAPLPEPDTDIICVICIDNDKQNLIFAECSHSFHRACLLKWLSSHNNCPLCRIVLNVKDYQEEQKLPNHNDQKEQKLPFENKEEFKYIPPRERERGSGRLIASYNSELPLSLQYNLPQHNTYRATSMNSRRQQQRMGNHFLGFHHMNRNPLG